MQLLWETDLVFPSQLQLVPHGHVSCLTRDLSALWPLELTSDHSCYPSSQGRVCCCEWTYFTLTLGPIAWADPAMLLIVNQDGFFNNESIPQNFEQKLEKVFLKSRDDPKALNGRTPDLVIFERCALIVACYEPRPST